MGDDNYELVLTMGSQVKEAKCFHHAKNFERVFTDWDAIVPAFLNYMNRKWTFLNKVNQFFGVVFALMVLVTFVCKLISGKKKEVEKEVEKEVKSGESDKDSAEEKPKEEKTLDEKKKQ